MAEVPEIYVAAVQDQAGPSFRENTGPVAAMDAQETAVPAVVCIPSIPDRIPAIEEEVHQRRTSRVRPWLSTTEHFRPYHHVAPHEMNLFDGFLGCTTAYLEAAVAKQSCCDDTYMFDVPSLRREVFVAVRDIGKPPLLPAFRRRGSRSSGEDECPLRPVYIDDWRRVLVYASCVRRLFSNSDHLVIVDMLPIISMCLPQDLLPKLESIHWWHSDPSRWWQLDPTWHYIQLFLMPSLVTISVELPCTGAPSFLSTLAAKCPNLKNVTVKHGPAGVYLDSTTEIQDVSLFARSLHSLESVSARRLDTAALQHLSQLSGLKLLSLDHLPEASSTFFPPHSRKNLPALRTLHFGQTHLRPVIKILEWCNEAPLESFSIHLSEVHTASAMHSFCVALSAACSHSSLTSLFVENDADDLWGEEQDHVVENHSIALLFCFTNLTSVAITSPPGFELDNATVSDMAQAWPMLESVALVTKFFERPPSTTLDCLSYFAAYCPHLESLTMTFDGTVPPDTAFGTTNLIAGHRLHHLDVGHSPIFSAIPAAGFIASLFPNLQDIRTGREHLENNLTALGEWELAEHGEGIGYYNCWKEVEEEVQYLLQKSQPWRLPNYPALGWRESLLLQISEDFDSR
ncbi:hypothetical protein C8R43DRAFT_1170365 [Mycena crocata]|nr:hypothetical protein C8R43DRAFT_1170365 [Mycena crocata]